jgi:hypothetical protein
MIPYLNKKLLAIFNERARIYRAAHLLFQNGVTPTSFRSDIAGIQGFNDITLNNIENELRDNYKKWLEETK